MASEVLIVWCLLSKICLTESKFLHINSNELYEVAVEKCHNLNSELLTLSTYRQYLDAQSYFNLPTSPMGSWLGFEFNFTTGNYQWLNGRVVTELEWEANEPKNASGTDCGVIDVYSRLWYSIPCTDNRHYLCVGSDGSYSESSVSVDFYTAVSNCRSEDRRLPVAITNLDTNWLNGVISTESISNDIWLGLIEYGDYFRWLNGEHLTPPYTWINSIRYATAFYLHYFQGVKIKSFSSCRNCIGPPVCQTIKSTDTTAKFVFVSNDANVLGSIRKTITMNPIRRFQCALECLRDADCIQYTIQGYLCRTFGEILLIIEYSEGSTLWQRKIIL